MKAKLTFDLSDPDDSIEHLRCVNARNLCIVLWDIQEFLRAKMKYDEHDSAAAIDAYEETQNKLCEIMQENGINLDELYQ